jgi:hypothetical protein
MVSEPSLGRCLHSGVRLERKPALARAKPSAATEPVKNTSRPQVLHPEKKRRDESHRRGALRGLLAQVSSFVLAFCV